MLWGGTVGESGWEGLKLGGHDHIGEAFVDFQRALKGLTRRGIQLAIVSKNDESTALEAIDRHPEMQLRRDDFAGWRINWNDKAENIVELLGGDRPWRGVRGVRRRQRDRTRPRRECDTRGPRS